MSAPLTPQQRDTLISMIRRGAKPEAIVAETGLPHERVMALIMGGYGAEPRRKTPAKPWARRRA